METEGVIPDDLQRDFNRALTPITTLRNLESLAMVGGKATSCHGEEVLGGMMTRVMTSSLDL